ncbi:MAG: hypothetical protein U0R17_00400 [Acidimicrobiia bacterium]
MKFVAGLFVDNIQFNKDENNATKIDIDGAFFSFKPESYPTVFQPHLVLLINAVGSTKPTDTLITEFFINDEIVSRNVQPCPVEPGKFGYRLVRPELEVKEPVTIIAKCTLTDSNETIEIPLTAM